MAATKHTRRSRGKDGSELSNAFQDRIEAERRRLQKASAVLIALVYSLTQAMDSEQAGDVAGVALDLVEQAILALDAVELRKAR
jgi:ABC-type phosphate transport system auxiliary subunit